MLPPLLGRFLARPCRTLVRRMPLLGRHRATRRFLARRLFRGGRGAAPGARTCTTAILLVDRRPGARLGFFLRDATCLVTLLDFFSLVLLLRGIGLLASSRHDILRAITNPE